MIDPRVRVLVIDDDEHVRAALQEVIDGQRDLLWVGYADHAEAAVPACATHHPDVAVIDIRIPGGGVTATRDVRERCPDVTVVALSAFSDRRHRELMAAAGATSYVVKGAPSEQLLAAIRDAARPR